MGDTRSSENDTLKIQLKILYILLLLVLLYLLVQAVLSGFVYVNQYRLNAKIDQWYENQSVPALIEWKNLEERVLSYLGRDERNVDIVNASGRLYDYRSAYMAADRKKEIVYGHKAIEYYRQVTRLRPAWPYGWMNLASSKARLGEVDGEFRLALLQLLHLGPWEENTLPTIIQLSLFAWPYLDRATRQPLLDYFVDAQENRREDVYMVLKEAGQLKLYCALMAYKGDKASFCP